MTRRRPAPGIVLALVLGGLAAGPAPAQDLGPSTGGVGALDQALRFLGHHKRVLMIGAHPDDEDTEILTIAARGFGAETAYLSLTRGEGGQNVIGPELGDALGVLRTEELLAARQLDGARQFFTRAFDFGYSKGLADTWRHWPRDSILKDVVRLVRRFRPQVIVSVFSGTVRDGHGQHQAAGWAAREAFRVAGDPSVFPELAVEDGIAPWTPGKLYQSARFDREAADLTLDGGILDPAVGQSFHQIAMRSRSLHRSQDMGVLQPIGPSVARLQLLLDRTGRGRDGFFAGIDTSLASLAPPGASAAIRRRLAALEREFRALRPWAAHDLPRLRTEFARLTGDPDAPPSPGAADQLARMDAALFLASDVLCDALSPLDRLVPGRTIPMWVSCWNASGASRGVSVIVRAFGKETGIDLGLLGPGELRSDTLLVTVPPDAAPTTPYYLTLPKMAGAALYQWPREGPRGEPFEPPPAIATVRLASGGMLVREVTYRFVDQARGETRRPLMVVPPVTLSLLPSTVLGPVGIAERTLEVGVGPTDGDPIAVRVGLEVPAEWSVDPPATTLQTGAARERILRFRVAPPPGTAGRFQARAVATDAGGRRMDAHLVSISYPHIRPRQVVQAAVTELSLAPLTLPALGAIGYVRGAADRVPEVLRTMGLEVVLLDADSLLRGDLSRHPTVVIGPRAYEVEPALLQATGRLQEFVRQGGTLIVQYQQHIYFQGDFAPYPLALAEPSAGGQSLFRMAAPRVAEEDAPVRMLAADHPALRVPHRIAESDWDGWIQERGLYFARSWGPEWTPLLELADTGETPLRGGLLVSRLGDGYYVYTGLSFLRQLPAGVPGAARLFLNLLALGSSDASR